MIRKRMELSRLTTIHLEGLIDVNIIEDTEDIFELSDNFFMLGGGSNLLIKNQKEEFYKLSKAFSYVKTENGLLICGGALRINDLVRFLIDNSVSSLEFLSGVPATVGGAVVMNAGAFGSSIGEKIVYVKVFCIGSGIVVMPKNRLEFGYRMSNIDNNCVVLEAGFRYETINKENLKKRVAENIKTRVSKAHLTNTFGSIFKNPEGDYAGRLMELSGLKGVAKDTAKISDKHANFMLGSRKTRIDDVLFLIDMAKNEVLKNFGVELEEEVVIV